MKTILLAITLLSLAACVPTNGTVYIPRFERLPDPVPLQLHTPSYKPYNNVWQPQRQVLCTTYFIGSTAYTNCR